MVGKALLLPKEEATRRTIHTLHLLQCHQRKDPAYGEGLVVG